MKQQPFAASLMALQCVLLLPIAEYEPFKCKFLGAYHFSLIASPPYFNF